jgi:hypothetical protein
MEEDGGNSVDECRTNRISAAGSHVHIRILHADIPLLSTFHLHVTYPFTYAPVHLYPHTFTHKRTHTDTCIHTHTSPVFSRMLVVDFNG